MSEEVREIQTEQDNDFKYVMMDVGNLYFGARFSFGELLKEEMVPFKMKAILTHYVLKEADAETTLESQFYYMEKGTFLYDTFIQLKTKVKVNVLTEKKGLLRKKKQVYEERTLPLKELAEMNLAKKKAAGMIIREIVISKLGMMTFSL